MKKEDRRFAYDEEEKRHDSSEESKGRKCLLSRWGLAAFMQTRIA